ncbi:YvrJ family protein [Salsuginibacillus kocurii]|uniref:YvrJ family protein n=1 Tax=Salsuginibacillus kocurii TaxID=427078 RepID=UPI00037199A0|nr:YvrJ family protein [Salsuginibacillus kocurii]
MNEVPEWAVLVGNYGFPTLVAIYLLVRFERRIDGLTETIQKLKISNNLEE